MIKSLFSVYFGKFTALAANLVLSILIVRVLSLSEKGAYEIYVTTYSLIIQFSNLGLHTSFGYYLAQKRNNLNRIVSGTCIYLLCFLVLLMLGNMMALKYCDNVSFLLSMDFIIIGLMTYTFIYQICFTLNDMLICNMLEVLRSLLPVILLLYLKNKMNMQAVDIVWLNAICCVSTVMLIFCIFIKKYKIKFEIDINFLFGCLPYGIKSYIVILLAYLVLRVDLFMIETILGAESIAIYSIAVNMIDVIIIIPSVLGQLFFVRLVEMRNGDSINNIMKGIFYFVILFVLGELIIYLVSPTFIPLLFGKSYENSIDIFRILLVGCFFWGLDSIARQFAFSKGCFRYSIYGLIIGILANIAINYFLLGFIGIKGAAYASNISYIICFVFSVIGVVRICREV